MKLQILKFKYKNENGYFAMRHYTTPSISIDITPYFIQIQFDIWCYRFYVIINRKKDAKTY